jgi:hypothetical protein
MRADPSLVAPLRIRTPHASQQSPVERISSVEVGHDLMSAQRFLPEPDVPRSVDTS